MRTPIRLFEGVAGVREPFVQLMKDRRAPKCRVWNRPPTPKWGLWELSPLCLAALSTSPEHSQVIMADLGISEEERRGRL
jgi:hypothetical protein